MVQKQDKTASGGTHAEKKRARQERQAQSLRQNLLRRKAQIRDRTAADSAPGAVETREDETPKG
jgi:hypothetical protein